MMVRKLFKFQKVKYDFFREHKRLHGIGVIVEYNEQFQYCHVMLSDGVRLRYVPIWACTPLFGLLENKT